MTINHEQKFHDFDSPSCLFVDVMSYWLPLQCGFFGRILPPRSLILINFGLTSISLLNCCFWLAIVVQILWRHGLFRKCLCNFISSGENKTLWQCVPFQLVSLTLSLCECPYGGRWVHPHGQLVFSPPSACWQSPSSWWSPTGSKQTMSVSRFRLG